MKSGQFLGREQFPHVAPRDLRRERAFLLPFGPYFYEWGRVIGSTKLLDDRERAEILLALLGVHERRTEEHGCLRAIAGIHAAVIGGVEKLARLLPAERAMGLKRGGVQLALRGTESEFLRKFHASVTR